MSKNVQVALIFEVGHYGWSESYYHDLPDGTPINALEKRSNALAKARMKLCGTGVTLTFARLSDVKVRRDADDIELQLVTAATGTVSLGVGVGAALVPPTVIVPAEQTPSCNPNVAVICRIENDDKVYHGQHFLSGIPKTIVGGGEQIQRIGPWIDEAGKYEKFLIENGWLFPVLSRTAPNQDRPVTFIDGGSNKIFTATAGLALGDRVRVINATKQKGETTRTCVGVIGELGTDTTRGTFFAYKENQHISGWTVGPKTLAHREETIYVAIDAFDPEFISHRNRGRPSRSPRGRRKR